MPTESKTKRDATIRPKRIRRVLSVTIHPTAIAALDDRAKELGIARSRMIERLALEHCVGESEHPEMSLRVRYVRGSGFEVEETAP